MSRILGFVLAAATLALGFAGPASADETPAPLVAAPAVAARAHLIYRADPHARPIEGRATVLTAGPPPGRNPRDSDAGGQVSLLILALQQR